MDTPYSNPAYDENRLEFTFVITGRNGDEHKKIKFSKLEEFGAYNLALGTINSNGKVDYSEITNNGDLLLLFSTIIYCIDLFLEKHISSKVFFAGNTKQKTKIYQEILRRHYQSFSRKFHIFGIVENGHIVTIEEFNEGYDYSGFIIYYKQEML